MILSLVGASAVYARESPEQRIQAAGLNPAAFQALLQACESSQTDALVLLHKGQLLVCQPTPDRCARLPLRSITKSIVCLAIGSLIAEGKISSLDAPISTWFPEWKQGQHAKVTLRHILQHTSGLEHAPADGKMMAQPDVLAYVRGLPIVSEPGSQFSYNGEAVTLLSGIIRQASGERVSQYVNRVFFKPMEITDWSWEQDRAGNDLAHTGLALRPDDLAKVGQLMLDQGQWHGKQLIAKDWITACLTSSPKEPNHGMLWWLLLDRKGKAVGFNANGWLGQHLVVFPDRALVAVRMRRGSATPTDDENQKLGLLRFPSLVRALCAAGTPK